MNTSSSTFKKDSMLWIQKNCRTYWRKLAVSSKPRIFMSSSSWIRALTPSYVPKSTFLPPPRKTWVKTIKIWSKPCSEKFSLPYPTYQFTKRLKKLKPSTHIWLKIHEHQVKVWWLSYSRTATSNWLILCGSSHFARISDLRKSKKENKSRKKEVWNLWSHSMKRKRTGDRERRALRLM